MYKNGYYVFALLAIILIISGWLFLNTFSAEPTQVVKASSLTYQSPRLRGFMVPDLSKNNLIDAKTNWGANSVRYMLRPAFIQARDGISQVEGMKKIMTELPQGLDNAKELGIAVILAMNPYLLNESEYAGLSYDEQMSKWWLDDLNKNAYIETWKGIARICADRNQEIWYDIMNEPLDRKDMPSYPKGWPTFAQKTIDAIRFIDKKKPIVIEPGPGGLCWGFWDFPRLKGEPIIYSVHQYQPHAYTHQGILNLTGTDLIKAFAAMHCVWPGKYDDSGGGYWDKARILGELAPVLNFKKNNPSARIYVGEFSVVRWAPNGEQYLKDNVEIFESLGWDWSYHAFRESPYWSLELTPEIEEKRAESLTARGQIIHDFMKRNYAKTP